MPARPKRFGIDPGRARRRSDGAARRVREHGPTGLPASASSTTTTRACSTGAGRSALRQDRADPQPAGKLRLAARSPGRDRPVEAGRPEARQDGAHRFDAGRSSRRHLAESRGVPGRHHAQRLQAQRADGVLPDYEDVGDVEVMNGLARFLGVDAARRATSTKTKKQNPEALADKVANYDEMEAALAGSTSSTWPATRISSRAAGPPCPASSPRPRRRCCYMPIRVGPERGGADWLAALDGAARDALQTTASPRRSLRQWKRRTPASAASPCCATRSRGCTPPSASACPAAGRDRRRTGDLRTTAAQLLRLPMPEAAAERPGY